MTIHEAIKRLQELTAYLGELETRGDISALKLAIEALKILSKCRAQTCSTATLLLPGETKE